MNVVVLSNSILMLIPIPLGTNHLDVIFDYFIPKEFQMLHFFQSFLQGIGEIHF